MRLTGRELHNTYVLNSEAERNIKNCDYTRYNVAGKGINIDQISIYDEKEQRIGTGVMIKQKVKPQWGAK